MIDINKNSYDNNCNNSHIQITRSIIKNFGTRKKVNYLDLENKKIDDSSPKKLGAEIGYYDDTIEKLLRDEIETPVGNTFKDISNFSKNKMKEIIITDSDKIKRFIEYMIVRSPKYCENFINKANLVIRNKEDLRILHNIIISLYNGDKFYDYNLTLFINRSSIRIYYSK